MHRALRVLDQIEPHIHHRSHLSIVELAFVFAWFMASSVAPQLPLWPMVLAMTLALMTAFFLLASARQLRTLARARSPLLPELGIAVASGRTPGDPMWRYLWSLREVPHLRSFLVLDMVAWSLGAIAGLTSLVALVFYAI